MLFNFFVTFYNFVLSAKLVIDLDLIIIYNSGLKIDLTASYCGMWFSFIPTSHPNGLLKASF